MKLSRHACIPVPVRLSLRKKSRTAEDCLSLHFFVRVPQAVRLFSEDILFRFLCEAVDRNNIWLTDKIKKSLT